MRVRGPRLSIQCAFAILSFLHVAAGVAYHEHEAYGTPVVLLTALARLLAESLEDRPNGLLDMRNIRDATLRSALRWRAQCLLQLVPELEMWEIVAAWSRAFHRKLRMMLVSIISITTRRNATRTVEQRLQTQSTVSTKRKRAKLHKSRPPAVGNLPCRFDDTPDRSSVPSCVRTLKWCRVHELKSVPLPTGALQNILPQHQGVESYTNWQQVEQLNRVSCWKLGRALRAGRPTVFSMGNAQRAISAWQRRRTKQCNHCPPLRVLSSFLEHSVVPTMLASPSGHIWDANSNSALPCDLRQYAALSGLLFCLPALRVAARVVTPSQMRCDGVAFDPSRPVVITVLLAYWPADR